MMRMASLAQTACVSVDARCLETALPAIPSSTLSALIAKALLIPHIDALILRFLESLSLTIEGFTLADHGWSNGSVQMVARAMERV